MFTDAKPSTTDDEEEEVVVESAFIHDADTLQIVAPLGYPFRDDLRQNLLLDWYTEVEPVSATSQSWLWIANLVWQVYHFFSN